MTLCRIKSRLTNFYQRAGALASFNGWARAVLSILKIKTFPKSLSSVSYLGKRVFFRPEDELAIREVLVNEEYVFLTNMIAQSPSPLVFDVGSHIGTFARWVLGVNKSASVISVEADPSTFKMLEINRRELGMGDQWQVLNFAAGDSDGRSASFSDSGPSMSHRVDATGSINISTVSLNTLLENFSTARPLVDVVKVDIEGAEADFLTSDVRNLGRIKTLVVEMHPYLMNAASLKSILTSSFPTVQVVGNRTSSKPVLLCTR